MQCEEEKYMTDKMKVSVEVVPTSGPKTNKDVEVDKTGATLGEVLQQAGVDGKNMQLTLNGEPASLTTHVKQGGKVGVKVQATERARGS